MQGPLKHQLLPGANRQSPRAPATVDRPRPAVHLPCLGSPQLKFMTTERYQQRQLTRKQSATQRPLA